VGEPVNEMISGYSVLWFSKSLPLGEFIEQIAPTAFDRDLSARTNVKALGGHDVHRLLGDIRSGTLELTKDRRGLFARITPPDTTYAADLLAARRRGLGLGWSFGFVVRADVWELADPLPLRTVISADLREVSAGVAFPAYEQTETASTAHSATASQAYCYNREAAGLVARRLLELAAQRHDPDILIAANYETNPPRIRVCSPTRARRPRATGASVPLSILKAKQRLAALA
jgi:HK97 family phage prohead protease